MKPTLLFVYNAQTGVFNKLTDLAHKIISPRTYACSLCALTYGKFNRKQEWTAYIKSLPLQVAFIYRNEWEFASVCNQYPLVALQTHDNHLQVLIKAEELNQLKSLRQLKDRLNQALQGTCC